jgi:hypothetical protein
MDWVILILILVIVWLVWSRRRDGFSQQIPKQIWTYWEDPTLPPLVQRCVDKWRELNPSWTLTILNKNSLNQYIPDVDIFSFKFSDTIQRRSDFIRLHVLARWGGVWTDASIFPTKPVDWVLEGGKWDYIGYYRSGVTTLPEYPVIESWFFACPPGSNFVSKLRDELMTMNTLDTEADYKGLVMERGVDIQGIPQPDYLNIYLAAQVVLQKQMTPEEIKKTISVKSAEDGPFKFATKNNWDPVTTMKSICDADPVSLPELVKIYGNERRAIEGNPDLECIYKILK